MPSNAETHILCRDCVSWQDASLVTRCHECGSPRLLNHTELKQLTIAHVDCDAFYAAVEKRDNPQLRDKPVIIGGGKRGVVATACYIARIRGVHSAQPMWKALEACPDAVIVRPCFEKYANAGRIIRQMMLELTPMVEPLSIDEAFLDLTGTARLHKASPAEVLVRFAKRVQEELDLTVSVGLSYCKFLAKVASDLNKPRGFTVIGEAEAIGFLRKQPVSVIWGVGKVTQKQLKKDGITSLATIQDMNDKDLAHRYGSMGLHMAKLARGEDVRMVKPGRGAKSVSAETTFKEDYADLGNLLPILRRLSQKVSNRLKDKHIAGTTVTLKLKTTDFKLRTRARQLIHPTQLEDRIFRMGAELLESELDGTKFRLIGIGVSSLRPDDNADPDDLVDVEATKRAHTERAIDRVRAKFGDDAVRFGLTLEK